MTVPDKSWCHVRRLAWGTGTVATSPEITRYSMFSAACLALNLGLGKISNLLALPITFDTIGTIIGAALLPWPYVLVVAVGSSLIGGLFIHPVFPFYAGTQIAIALVALAAVRFGAFNKWWTAALTGLLIGVVSAVVSAPVTALVFGGVTIPSITALNVLFIASGEGLMQSVVQGAMIVESIDKTIACLLVFLLLTRLPPHLRKQH